jgi:hypothetical protein
MGFLHNESSMEKPASLPTVPSGRQYACDAVASSVKHCKLALALQHRRFAQFSNRDQNPPQYGGIP